MKHINTDRITEIQEITRGSRPVEDFRRRIAREQAQRLEDQTSLAVATVMHKLGERLLTITHADIEAMHGRRVTMNTTAEGLVIKID